VALIENILIESFTQAVPSTPDAYLWYYSYEQSQSSNQLGIGAEQAAAIQRWREQKTAARLLAAGFSYLLVSQDWIGFLSAEEQGLLQEQYRLRGQITVLVPAEIGDNMSPVSLFFYEAEPPASP
jgi:hypothetical protein